jgi:nucleolar protein 58
LVVLQIKAMGTRDKSADVDFSGVLEQEVEDALKAAAQISMGTEISEEDLSNIIALCDQVRNPCSSVLSKTFCG